MTQQELGIYFNWSCNQLAGDPIATDQYLRDHLEVVKKVSAQLLQDIGYTPQPIYRGVIVPESNLSELQPHSGFTYLSFSEDKKVAEIFADPSHDMAFGIRLRMGRRNLYGYMAEYTPKIEEVLFHHQFLQMFPYVDALLTRDIDASKINEQKEVTILQPSHCLPLTKHSFIIYENTNNEKRQTTCCDGS